MKGCGDMLRDRLKQLRRQQHLSQMALSKIIGVSQQTVGSWETGRTSPDNNMITTLAKHFHVSTDYLLGNTPTNNINIGTNNGAVSGSGNATYIERSSFDDKLEVSLRAMLGDSIEADDIVQALADFDTVFKDLDDFDKQHLRLYLQGIANVVKKAKTNSGD